MPFPVLFEPTASSGCVEDETHIMSTLFTPRHLLAASLSVALGLSFSVAAHAQTQLRIGYQKSSTLMVLLKQQGTLEKQLADQGVRVSWHEFASGQPLLEALNVGNVDLSADVADTVPVFAQAAGGKLTYYASESASPQAQAILVGVWGAMEPKTNVSPTNAFRCLLPRRPSRQNSCACRPPG